MVKKIILFLVVLGVSFLAANYRWNDSAHAIGVIKAGGGKARHPVALDAGEDRYMLIVTTRVLPPYHGDVNVTLEGRPAVTWDIYPSGPVIDAGLYQWPAFRDHTFYGLKPGDRLALWVRMVPPRVDPVCGMVVQDYWDLATFANGREYRFCCEACLEQFQKGSADYEGLDYARGKYTLAFRDTRTGASVLNIPIILKGEGGASDAGEDCH